MKLQTKFLAILFPLVVVPLLLIALVSRHYFEEMVATTTDQQSKILTDQLAWSINVGNSQALDLVDEITRYPSLKAAFSVINEQPQALQSAIETFQHLHPKLHGVEIASAEGITLAQAGISDLTTTPSNNLTNQPEVSSVGNHFYLTTATHANVSTEPQHGYTIKAVVKLDQLESLIENMRRKAHIILLLLNNNNQVLSGDQSIFDLLKTLTIQNNKLIQWQGNRYILNTQPLAQNLKMLSLTPTLNLESSSEALYSKLSYIMILAGLISIVVLHRGVASLITNPLKNFHLQTRNIINGDFNTLKPLRRADEVGELSRSFESMRAHLQDTSHQVEELAYFDTLTGLPNKVSFIDTIQHLIEKSQVSGHQVAILFFDLDNFKHINDGLGHEVGDSLLMQVSSRLKECIRSNDVLTKSNHIALHEADSMIARLGGDEFTLVLSKIDSPDQATKVAGRILKRLSMPFQLEDNQVFISASIGISIFPKDGRTPEALLKNADTAMYAAKSSGKNVSRFYDSKMNKPMLERIELEASMRSALTNNEFILYYQPKVPLFGAPRFEFETLMRWQHPEKGMISPGIFIPLAEDSGYIQNLGDWAIEQTCKQIEHWNSRGIKNITVSTNLSPVQLNYGNPLQTIKRCLASHDMEPQQLEIEITESGLMQNEKHAITVLNDIKALGVRIALDDFGTGYSSLAYLLKFPIDTLKIDRTFIRDIETNHESLKVLELIIGLAKSLNLHVVAEGVETKEQLDMLQIRECDYIQGFYFAKPCEPEQSMAFFERYFEEQTHSMVAVN